MGRRPSFVPKKNKKKWGEYANNKIHVKIIK